MQHFICTGSCHGEAAETGICQSEFCEKEGQNLLECNCTDGLHEKASEIVEDEGEDWDLGE